MHVLLTRGRSTKAIGAIAWGDRFGVRRRLGLSFGATKAIGAIAPPKTYESQFVPKSFKQIAKQQSRCKVNLLSIVLSQQCCEAYFISYSTESRMRLAYTQCSSKRRNCAVPADNLRSAISFSRTSNILNLIRYIYTA